MKFLVAITMFSIAAFAQTPMPMEKHRAEIREKVRGSLKMPRVFFVSPKDGDTVASKFKVVMGVEGMQVQPAGKLEAGTGHHHILVDGKPLPKGQVVPKDEKNIHFGKGEKETELTLAPGSHTLTLQFADGNHLSYGPELSATISIKVK